MQWKRCGGRLLKVQDGHLEMWCAGRRGRWGWRIWYHGDTIGGGYAVTLRAAVQAAEEEATKIDRSLFDRLYCLATGVPLMEG